jgi:CheY-like chemotaxis protein
MRVLVIDDDYDSSYFLSALVRHFGHDAKALTAPQEAVNLAKDWHPEFVFMDLAMPGMDGYGLARQLRDRAGLNDAKIFALSGYQRDRDREAAAGIDGHVLKPISAVTLKTLLDNAC